MCLFPYLKGFVLSEVLNAAFREVPTPFCEFKINLTWLIGRPGCRWKYSEQLGLQDVG
jgi:hypothetical protein